MVQGINYPGAITGFYTVANGRTFGFVRDPHGQFTSFDTGANTFPRSINNLGAITGSYTDSSGTHGFVRSPEGSVTSFDPPRELRFCPNLAQFPSFAPPTIPTGINDDGVITGYCQTGLIPVEVPGWVRFP